ncbi:MAG: hypothetical protein FJ098_06530 [Deltaproteobacteria bacterium]|nr:hypothetical protein [Deltaproteobacteria bacterium]
MAKKPSLRSHAEMEIDEINLTPIMSILVILIPMLVYAFNYNEIAVEEVSLPKTGGRGDGQGPRKLSLTVLLSEEGFRIKVQGESETGAPPPDKVVGKRMLAGCDGGAAINDFDFPGLYTELVKLRENRELGLEDTINVGAKDNIPWRILARTVDTVRLRREADSYQDLCEFRKAKLRKIKTKNGDGEETSVPQELFPKVVFIVL